MLKSDRIGLLVVVASLVAIGAIGYLVFDYQHNQRLESIRSQGIGLVRTLSAVPFDQLAPGGSQHNMLRLLGERAGADNFAYLSIVDPNGMPAYEFAADRLNVPLHPLPTDPSEWFGEASPPPLAGQNAVIEFHAPLFRDSELAGFVRIGYRYPGIGLSASQLPFFAAVALPVFLLVPLFYFLLRMEVRPLREASQHIGALLDDEQFRKVEITANGELGNFMQSFNRFVELANAKVEGFETDQKRLITSTKLLTYRKNRIETVLETLPEAIMILDESGSINFVNQKLAALFGVPSQTILSQPAQNWCDNQDLLRLLSAHAAEGQGRNFTETIRFEVESFSKRSYVTKAYPLFPTGRPSSSIGTLIVLRDETQEAMARQARGDFVAHLSHELKSPLNVLALYSESLLGDDGNKPEFRIEAANVIADEVARLGNLINGLLNITQIESGSLKPNKSLVKLRDVASAAFETAKHSAVGKGFHFEMIASPSMNPVMVDKELIRIAITNLLSNAVKYNTAGGEVRLTLEETEDAIQIRVADSGIGVSEEDASLIFDKLYRSTDERVQQISGHGIGLALTKQIIELHHGTLSLDRDREQGAEFIINLWKEATAVKQAI